MKARVGKAPTGAFMSIWAFMVRIRKSSLFPSFNTRKWFYLWYSTFEMTLARMRLAKICNRIWKIISWAYPLDSNTCRLCSRLETPNRWPVFDFENWHVLQQILLQGAFLHSQEWALMGRKDLISAHLTTIGAIAFYCNQLIKRWKLLSAVASRNFTSWELMRSAEWWWAWLLHFSDKKVIFIDSCQLLHNQNPVSWMLGDWSLESLRLQSFVIVFEWTKNTRANACMKLAIFFRHAKSESCKIYLNIFRMSLALIW